MFSVQSYAFRILQPKLPQIVDSIEPGGSGDPYAGLTVEERDALAEVTRLGFPLRSWFDATRVSLQYTTVWGRRSRPVIGLCRGVLRTRR